MARLALAVGAGIVGGVIAGPVGFKIGYALGTVAGGLIFGDEAKGPPRPEDRMVGGVAYGAPIAEVEGTAPVNGNLVWVKGNKLDVRKIEVEAGGKGMFGGAGGFTWAWYGTWHSVFCAGPIAGIRELRFGPKKVYDISAGPLADALAANGVIPSTYLPGISFRINLGGEDQLPDPYIQADRGADNVSGMRGLAGVTFIDVPLADFGNTIPQEITAIVVKNGTYQYLKRNLNSTEPSSPAASPVDFVLSPYNNYLWGCASGGAIARYDLLNASPTIKINPEGLLDTGGDPIDIGFGFPITDEFMNFYVPAGSAGAAEGVMFYRFDGNTFVCTGRAPIVVGSGSAGMTMRYRHYLGSAQRWIIGRELAGTLMLFNAETLTQAAPRVTGYNFAGLPEILPSGNVYAPWNNGSVSKLVKYRLDATPAGTVPYVITFVSEIVVTAAHGGGLTGCFYYEDEGVLILRSGSVISKFDPATDTIVASLTVAGGAGEGQLIPIDGRVWVGSNNTFSEIDLATLTIVRALARSNWSSSSSVTFVGYNRISDSFIAEINVAQDLHQLFLPRLDAGSEDLAAIITRASARVGLGASDIDVAAVSDTVRGYVLGRPTNVRAYLEPLLATHFTDATKVDGKIRYLPRGGAPVLTIDAEDLGARLVSGGEGAPTDRAVEELPMPEDLPRRLRFHHIDPDSNYDPNVQPAELPGEATVGVGEESITTAEVLTATEAKRIVEKTLHTSRIERPVRISLPRKYAQLICANVVTLPIDDRLYTARITGIGEGPLLEIDAVLQEAASYTSTVTGHETNIPNPALQITAPTELFLIDSNLLRDEDDNAGHYIGLAPLSGAGLWPGGQVFKSSDGGTSFAALVSYSEGVEWGIAENALGNHDCFTTDTGNTLTLRMMNGSAPASISDTGLWTGGNAMLVQSGNDWEVLQARDATSLGAGKVLLSTLARGRRGTEQQAAGHAAGDRVIILSAATLHRLVNAAEVGFARHYKAVTFGLAFSPIGAVQFTNNARGRMPYPPTEIRGTRNGSGDITCSWYRRTRIGGLINWSTNPALPLGEASELYKAEILDVAGVVALRTKSGLTSPTFSYPASEQTADFGAPQAAVKVRVRQIGTGGIEGRPALATI